MAASQGNCYLCGNTLGKTAMKNHVIREHSAGGEACWLVKAEGAYDKGYWLYFTVPKDASLSAVDKFLRQIWLECCGHLSAFRQGGREVGKSRKLSGFAPGDMLLHEYDFGSTTETLLTFVAEMERPAQKEKVQLLARNAPQESSCDKCGKAATFVNCWEGGESLCETCADAYEEGLLPLVNSPRCGECGYGGEQDRWTFDPAKIKQPVKTERPAAKAAQQPARQDITATPDTEPDLEQWAQLHEIAQRIKEMAPWDYLYDDNIVMIQLPDRDEPVYCSIMGAAGACFGIGMYPGNESFSRLKRMLNAPDSEPLFIMGLMQDCLNCYYGDRGELTQGERAALKALGIKYRGANQWVHFRSHKEGHQPQPIDRAEASLVIDVLQNLYMTLRAYLEGRVAVDFEKGETLFRWRDKKKEDQWFCAAVPWPEQMPFPMEMLMINEKFLAEMNAAKKTKQELELDVFYLPFQIKDDTRCPSCFIAANAKTGVILGQQTLDWDETPEEPMLDFLENWIKKEGRPAQIHTRSMFMGIHLHDFCDKTDIALKTEGTPAVDKIIGEMLAFMEGPA